MASRLSWFLTKSGRQFSFGFMCTASCTAFLARYAPHTFFINKYKEIVSMYQAAEAVPVAESVLKRWHEVLEDLNFPSYEVKYIEPFTVFGFDVFRAGSTASRYGAIIGIPINFTYRETETIDPSGILVNHEPVNWKRQDAKELLDALVLSENAQRYGIAREVLMARNNEPLVASCLATFMVSSTYLLGRGMNEKFNLFKAPIAVRGLFYGVAVLFSYGIWALQTDIINGYWEKDTDSHIAQLDDRYKSGAIEFYEKMLKRNVALRSLLGSKGESFYTPKGNEKHLFRQPTIPIDQRKKFFVESLDAVKRKSELLTEKAASPA